MGQGWRLLIVDAVQAESLSHHAAHGIGIPQRLTAGLLASRRLALRLSPLELHQVVHELHTPDAGWLGQKVAAIRHVVNPHINRVLSRLGRSHHAAEGKKSGYHPSSC